MDTPSSLTPSNPSVRTLQSFVVWYTPRCQLFSLSLGMWSTNYSTLQSHFTEGDSCKRMCEKADHLKPHPVKHGMRINVLCTSAHHVLIGKGCGLWKNLRTWHNRVTAVPWYNLYITINNIFLSEKGNYDFHIFHIHFVGEELGVWSPSVLVPQITSMLTPFILSIFSLSSYVSSSLSFGMSAKISRLGGFWIKARQFGRWRLKLLPQMSHKDGALMLFLPLCICECLSMSQLIKMKCWDH